MHFRPPSAVAEVGNVRPASRARTLAILAVPALSLLIPALAVEVASAGGTGQLTRSCAAIARFLLFYSGVFALVALTAAVAAGLLATDRVVMSPERRILAQAVHRTMSLIGISALANHILLEIMARRASIAAGFIPFLAARNTFYLGLGTVASDLFVLIIVTGVLRRRFARGGRRLVWRVLHATAYAAWPLGVLHGLLAGRSAKPYVDWSYGGCLAAVGLALIVRYIVAVRGRNAAAGMPVRAPVPLPSDPTATAEALAAYFAPRPLPSAPMTAANMPAALRRSLPPPRPAPSWFDTTGHPAGQDRR